MFVLRAEQLTLVEEDGWLTTAITLTRHEASFAIYATLD